MRRIVVDDRVWRWRVGRSHVVAVSKDPREKRVVDFSTLTGTPWSEIERSLWKKGRWAIHPSHVAAWLRTAAK